MKRIFPLAAVATVAGLAACSNAAAPAAAPASGPSVRVPVSCSQQYTTWNQGEGKGLIAALGTISTAETAGDAKVVTAALKTTKPALTWAAHHPVPACADPRGYWDVLLQHISAAAGSGSALSKHAALKGVPEIYQQLTGELKAL